MPWTTPSFEEIKMDAEARSYGLWVSDLEATADAADAEQSAEAAGTDE